MKRTILLAITTLSLALLAGCPPVLTAQSTAPPSRAARLDAISGFWGIENYRLELSKGVAIAISCTDAKPCEKMRVTSDDPNIVEVRDASLAQLEQQGTAYAPRTYERQTMSALVAIGKAPGKTTIRVRSADGDRDIYVTVVAPPMPAAQR
ncbi:MAG: hypothetical protein AB7T06_39690 [Kofleriaceae bacterium]